MLQCKVNISINMKKFIVIFLLMFCSNLFSQWINQKYPAGSQYIYFSSYFFNGSTGFIVGSGLSILKTTNGGSNWDLRFLNGYDFRGIDFISNSTGIAAGFYTTGLYSRTTDGGANWTKYYNPGGNFLYKIKYASGDTLYGCGYTGYIMKSTNGGLEFFQQISNTTEILSAMHVVNNNIVYAGGANGKLVKTTNGGTNWFSLQSNMDYDIIDMQFLNANMGYFAAYGSSGGIFRTVNGGLNWTRLPITPGIQMTAVYYVNSSVGYAVGVFQAGKFSYHKAIKTTDGGLDWQELPTGNFLWMRSVYFVNEYTGWITGDGNQILKTTSGGLTFINENGETISDFNLEQNYPNPFNPSTIINYQLTINSFVILNVYDVNGKLLKELVNEKQSAGNYSVDFDGSGLPSGTYIYRLQAGDFSETKKMVLLK